MVPVVTRENGLGLSVRKEPLRVCIPHASCDPTTCARVHPMRALPCVPVPESPQKRDHFTGAGGARKRSAGGARAARGRRDGGSGGEPKLSLMLTSPHQNHRKTEIPKIPRHKSVAIFAMFDHLGAFPLLRPKLHEYHPTPTNTARYLTST